jgi:peptidylprolyl isomerase
MRRFAALFVFVLAVPAAGCGDSGSQEVAGEGPGRSKANSKPLFAREMGAEGREWLREAAAETGGKGQDPRWAELQKTAGAQAQRLVLPHGAPPTEVVFRDLQVGQGPRLEPGDVFGANYTSFDYKTGRQVQKASNGSKAFYAYGEGELVKAWEPGLKGMRAGGLREMIAPGSWAYGSPVVYVLHLVTVEKEE